VHADHGLSGTTRARPGLREALAACRAGDVLVVTKLDRLARSLRDATDIADELTKKGVALNLGGAVYDPTDPVGRLLFNVLGMVAEFEADLIRARTREGMAIAKAAGKLRGRKPKLTPSQEKHLVQLHRTGAHTTSEIAELFGVARSTVYRAIQRERTRLRSRSRPNCRSPDEREFAAPEHSSTAIRRSSPNQCSSAKSSASLMPSAAHIADRCFGSFARISRKSDLSTVVASLGSIIAETFPSSLWE
jgi:DNA invertase Pin-like site-specific DNA recombinase